MELVPGPPITEYCGAHHFTTRQRLELLIPVCQAVQHAHQKGVLHRDLKPSNILVAEVDGKPVPKVIDFGVARAVEEPLTGKTLVTRAHQFLGTPGYMSPEQAGLDGLDVDSRTDVYSLGVVLYELLAGRTPLDTRGGPPESHDAVLRRVRDNEPPKPSKLWSTLDAAERAAAARMRGEDPQHIDRGLRQDLDWVVLKAIERDRDRRYATVSGLAADLRRYLANEPVAARPPSSLDRFRKVIRRHKAIAAAASAVSLALVAGLIRTTWQWLRAQQHLTEARLNAYASEMVVAQRALAENNLEHALRLLEPCRVQREEQDLRGFEWRYLWEQCRDRSRTHFTNAPPVAYPECTVAFSPDGRFFAHGGSGTICIRDGHHFQTLTNLTARADTLSFSPDSAFLVAALVEPTREGARLWETRVRSGASDSRPGSATAYTGLESSRD